MKSMKPVRSPTPPEASSPDRKVSEQRPPPLLRPNALLEVVWSPKRNPAANSIERASGRESVSIVEPLPQELPSASLPSWDLNPRGKRGGVQGVLQTSADAEGAGRRERPREAADQQPSLPSAKSEGERSLRLWELEEYRELKRRGQAGGISTPMQGQARAVVSGGGSGGGGDLLSPSPFAQLAKSGGLLHTPTAAPFSDSEGDVSGKALGAEGLLIDSIVWEHRGGAAGGVASVPSTPGMMSGMASLHQHQQAGDSRGGAGRAVAQELLFPEVTTKRWDPKVATAAAVGRGGNEPPVDVAALFSHPSEEPSPAVRSPGSPDGKEFDLLDVAHLRLHECVGDDARDDQASTPPNRP